LQKPERKDRFFQKSHAFHNVVYGGLHAISKAIHASDTYGQTMQQTPW
jgi:hypothetical protein